MSTEVDVWRACIGCGWYAEINFYNPDLIYCEDCGQKLGETDQPVESDLAALEVDEIVHADTGETLATVEWNDDRVEIHEGGPSSKPDSPVDEQERIHRETYGDRTITADRIPHDRELLRGTDSETVRVQVHDDDQDAMVELTRRQLKELSRVVGNRPRRPPRRDLLEIIETHMEIVDFGDHLSISLPHTLFKVRHHDFCEGEPWAVNERDEDVRMELEAALTRNTALVALLDRLGLLWNVDE